MLASVARRTLATCRAQPRVVQQNKIREFNTRNDKLLRKKFSNLEKRISSSLAETKNSYKEMADKDGELKYLRETLSDSGFSLVANVIGFSFMTAMITFCICR